jgi:hypothetical protein
MKKGKLDFLKLRAKILKERLARLGGKMGLILCGGGSEIEVHTNRDMIVDALNSVKMAMEYGMLVQNYIIIIIIIIAWRIICFNPWIKIIRPHSFGL